MEKGKSISSRLSRFAPNSWCKNTSASTTFDFAHYVVVFGNLRFPKFHLFSKVSTFKAVFEMNRFHG